MTTTPTTTTTTTIDRFLAAIEAGAGAGVADCYAPDAVLDATVTGWRFTKRGRTAIGEQFAGWYDAVSRFEELERCPTPTGEVVRYLVSSEHQGVPYAAHQFHMLTVDPATGLISEHHFYCGGRWDAALLARMEEEAGAC